MQGVDTELKIIEKELKEEKKELSFKIRELENNLRFINDKIKKVEEDNKRISSLFLSEKDSNNIRKLKVRDKDNQSIISELNKKIKEKEKALLEFETRINILTKQEDDEQNETDDKTRKKYELSKELDSQKKSLQLNEEKLERYYEVKAKLDEQKNKYNQCLLLRQPIIDKYEVSKELLNELKEINPNLANEINSFIDKEFLDAIDYLNNLKNFELME